MRAILLLGGCLFVAGCGHTFMRGSVVMKTSSTEGHVCLGDGEVAKGDAVVVSRNVCTPRPGAAKATDRTCQKVPVGHGIVTEVLNEHYSVVRMTDGELNEGDTVERTK